MNKFPVPQESLEAGLLSAIDQNIDRYLAIEAAGLKETDFVAYGSVFSWIKEHLEKYSTLPTNSQLTTRFNWTPPVGEFNYWLTEMKRYVMARNIMQAVKDVYEIAGEPEQALSLAIDRFSSIRAESANGHVQPTDADAEKRLENFRLRQQYIASNEIMGIHTGLKIIDSTKVGWMPGELIGVYARPGVGKTWWMIWQGALAWMQGYRVLAITPEMPVGQMNLRIDVTIGGLMGYHMDYTKVMAGDPSQQMMYETVLHQMAQNKRWWTYDSLNGRSIGLSELIALQKLHSPQIILIDGISLLRSEGRSATWEKMLELSYGLKNLATINNIPIIVNHQSTRPESSSKKQGEGRGDYFVMPSLSDAAYGDSFVQACSTIITMAPDPNAYYLQWYALKKVRERGWDKPLPVRMAMAWEPAHGRIHDLSEFGADTDKVTSEAWKVLGRSGIQRSN